MRIFFLLLSIVTGLTLIHNFNYSFEYSIGVLVCIFVFIACAFEPIKDDTPTVAKVKRVIGHK